MIKLILLRLKGSKTNKIF